MSVARKKSGERWEKRRNPWSNSLRGSRCLSSLSKQTAAGHAESQMAMADIKSPEFRRNEKKKKKGDLSLFRKCLHVWREKPKADVSGRFLRWRYIGFILGMSPSCYERHYVSQTREPVADDAMKKKFNANL